MTRRTHPRQQSGAALLAAMLTVALVATFAAGAVWQQWRSIEVEGADRQRTQIRWLLTGALDWARVILREDGLSGGGVDHLAEPWAIPLAEVRLSSFLAALPDGTGNTSAEDSTLARQVLLSGQITDVQGRLNIGNLLDNEQPERLDPVALFTLTRLFDVLGLPPEQLSLLTQGVFAARPKNTTGPLMPQRVAQLSWLGLSPKTLQTLAPHITVLPERTTINLNTASAQVLYASLPQLSFTDAQRLVQVRERQHWSSIEAFQKSWGRSVPLQASHSVSTNYFEVLGRLRMPQTTVQELSLVRRQSNDIRVIWRSVTTGQT